MTRAALDDTLDVASTFDSRAESIQQYKSTIIDEH